MQRQGTSASMAGARKRDAAATRQAILDAARKAFTEIGYEGAGVRDIAARAGINPALVNRYFGSKEALFEDAIATAFDINPILKLATRETLARVLARHATAKAEMETTFNPIRAMVRSIGHPKAAELMRQGLVKRFIRPLAQFLGGDDAAGSAALVAAILAGFAMMQIMLELDTLEHRQSIDDRLVMLLDHLMVDRGSIARRLDQEIS